MCIRDRGYSDGESVRITIYKGKPLESQVESFLTNVGEWIGTVAFTNTIRQRAETVSYTHLSIENEELNSLLTTIRNQATEIEVLNKEVASMRNNLEHFNEEHATRKALAEKESDEKPEKKAKEVKKAKTTAKKATKKTKAASDDSKE